jgi:hypothetical protein
MVSSEECKSKEFLGKMEEGRWKMEEGKGGFLCYNFFGTIYFVQFIL